MPLPFFAWVYLSLLTTIAGELLNSQLTFHDDNKCITANGLTNIQVDADYMCHMTITYFT